MIHWLARPWFHRSAAITTTTVCRYESCDRENWIRNGGGWFQHLTPAEQAAFAVHYRSLPLAIEVATTAGPSGCFTPIAPFSSWQGLLDQLDAGVSGGRLRAIKNVCLWSRRRIERLDESGVADLAALVVGHTPVRVPVRLGNVHYIDTGGWVSRGGRLLHPAGPQYPDSSLFPSPEPDRWDDQAHGQRPLPIKAPGERPGLRSASAMVYHAGNCGAWHPTQAPGAAVIGYSFRAT
ncbi:hypothetical protein [Aeromonas caviae]|uniref:hypothetical protein n=1 Tax=Aeromonas caviae TaxID=648 RepID=UPI00067D1FC9|nr:hypothetical protein [Aeromonas caviae]